MARTTLTPETHKAIVDAVALGTPYEFAFAAAGVGKTAFYKWLRRGSKGEQPYAHFAHDIKRAKAEAVRVRVERIGKAAATYWQADAWFLERVYPEHFGRESERIRKAEQRLDELEKRNNGGGT